MECRPRCRRRRQLVLKEAGGRRGSLGTEVGRRERQWAVEMLGEKHRANSWELLVKEEVMAWCREEAGGGAWGEAREQVFGEMEGIHER